MNGKLLWTSGHLHDGGTMQVMYINGRPMCNSTQFYARNYEFGHSMHNGAKPMNNNGPQPNYNQPYYGPNGPQAYNGPSAPPQGYYGPYAQGYPTQQGANNMPQSYPMQQGANGLPQDYNTQQGANGQNMPPQENMYPQQYNDPNARPLQYNHKRQDMNHGGAFGGDHIESPGACTDFGDIRKGDVMTTKAFYDMTVHRPMTHKGEEEKIMGNMRVFIGPVD
jgi:hypothetical protein